MTLPSAIDSPSSIQRVGPQDHYYAEVTTPFSVTMSPPTEPKARHKMPLLPAEIIFAICRCFVVKPHNPEEGFHVSLSARDNIRTLRQLSLVCRGIHHVVTPILYGSIYFTGPETDTHHSIPTDRQNPGAENLVYFLRTILENSKLRQYVKDIACLIKLRDACDFEEEMKTLNKDYGILSTIRKCKDKETKRLLVMAELWIDLSEESKLGFEAAFGANARRPIISVSLQIFTLIISLLPNVDSLALQTNPVGPPASLWYLLHDSGAIGTMGWSGFSTIQHKPLQSLRTVRVQCWSQSPFSDAHDNVIGVLEILPVLENASNLTHFQGYGCVPCWMDLPRTVVSFESWGLVSDSPLLAYSLKLKSIVIQLVSPSRVLDFNLEYFGQFCTNRFAPTLEHLEVSLWPGTTTKSTSEFRPTFGLRGLTRLQSLCFDTHFISSRDWEDSMWLVPGSGLSALPPNIESLRLIDSEPGHDFDRILVRLQTITRIHLRPENNSKLKRVEYIHMPSLAGSHRNAGSCSTSDLVKEVLQELEINGVELQLHWRNPKGEGFSGAKVLEHEGIPA